MFLVPAAVLDHSFSFCINTMHLFCELIDVCERVDVKTVQPEDSVTLVGYKLITIIL